MRTQLPNHQFAGRGGLLQGFEPDYEAEDDVTRAFGDQEETSISVAIALATGAEVPNAQTASSSTNSSFDTFQIGGAKNFNRMVENRKEMRSKVWSFLSVVSGKI